ncbi:MAG: 1-(5-phosphoribosyl)-5-[(5-phosphoribosylamino)methylideneamino]imidazole-4-carboxamide isomerase [Pirellulales bacterium]|jgi:phosphoribosylformimino-5-aminoimidazole carboxamide ribotide isomerase|nr:1-(5-phosphoribosyl)-5-[(5-phosphoribosylamino)methylideneamino]imidazole-4-carboxamide isomerase [Pirellulales bacterium]MDA7992393.1 1-(5-phosphoribosyl)-5-[(5-phosphoribosylamino)methylideneamino]imidazole-4-carboxamide isomerase [Pirellulales bacterium]MEC8737744.1 1-(5-phosphoribosyl)-5-[(5-phosphoribosylamino)methylideneamino]imidazole-4-carboxamide isomerase [Planctomycetota bacterium]MEE2795918.1 1-(5-phosphoribosyl)-5-[(5-phosphoribosylamino)methylideneamino]imidazole-4-carboxamide i|tara:strand:- start:306 stop:1028 length:723 start_codon:yes stop_codon:yes gene_type:complete
MELWPAIDLRGGCCVRLQQGDYGRETVFGEDPVKTVKQFVSSGSRRLHIVDLEGAKDGAAIQANLIGEMVAAAGVPCQVGGGIRSRNIIEAYLEAGVSRLVIGSVAIEHPTLFAELAMAFPHTLVLGLDAREGKLASRGWIETSTQQAVEVAAKSAELPLAAIVYTDIARDGMLQGPNLPALEAMVQASPHPVVASGGIADADDLRAVAATGASGCIVGRALYDGGLTLSAAIEASGESL